MTEANVEFLTEKMESLGLNPPGLAQKTGIKRATLSRIVKGGSTKIDKLKKIADVIGVDVRELIVGKVQNGGNPDDKPLMGQIASSGMGDGLVEGLRVQPLVAKAMEILGSSSIYSQALAANINAFYTSLRTEEKNLNLQAQIDRIQSRITTLEEKIKSEGG